jgi:hypothetical protein
LITKSVQALFVESSPPLPNHLRAHLKAAGDLYVGYAIGRIEHDLRALHVAIRQRQLRSPALKLSALRLGERDLDRRGHRHQDSPPAL